MVIYEGKKFSGETFGQKKVMKKRCAAYRSHGIAELQDFQWLGDAVFYAKVFNPEVVPKMFFSAEDGSGSTRKTKILCLHICILQTVSNKQVLKNQTFFLPWQCPSVTTRQSLTKLQKSPFL